MWRVSRRSLSLTLCVSLYGRLPVIAVASNYYYTRDDNDAPIPVFRYLVNPVATIIFILLRFCCGKKITLDRKKLAVNAFKRPPTFRAASEKRNNFKHSRENDTMIVDVTIKYVFDKRERKTKKNVQHIETNKNKYTLSFIIFFHHDEYNHWRTHDGGEGRFKLRFTCRPRGQSIIII